MYLDFDCKVIHDLHSSDHNPILITFNKETFELERNAKWNFKKANWEKFKKDCEEEINSTILNDQEDEMVSFTEKLLEIATNNIPMTSTSFKKNNKPWFDEECRIAKRERNRANRLNRRYPGDDNAMKAKVATARARRTFK